ncbi:uncharacterized protein B0I36DRAFT_311080 [Microdochium trichocladiopsis]|uniref:Rhodopsin domain-containing protein n=1 Tax=Microdochium trichocladiopsis TaxID=1682393 RepID=A0A9P8YJK7_9PEZI|nr:uncharacterized protein B0I36DRAFT_311080 [Microdochium trichocladiopsis]KAH7040606.1 hypothetical protein B0I36DRAFT_311080 [Microdochium trichocladiopsis]
MGNSLTEPDLWTTIDTLQDPQPEWNKPSFIIAITAISLGIATICITFRLYTRLRLVRSPGWDDFFVTMYLMTGIMAGVALCISTKFGNGEHLLDLVFEPERLRRFLKTFYVCNAGITMSMTIIKLSLLFQYLRLFERGWIRIACIITLVAVAAVGLAYTVLSWVPCWPISDYWDFDYFTGDKNCWGFASNNHDQFYYTYLSWNILNLVGDLVILCLPLPMFFDPKTTHKTKWGLIGLVAMGAIANCLCIWRLVETVYNRAGTYPKFDPPWNAPIIMVLGILEVNLGSVCASVPIFWPVLTAQIGRVFVTHEISITHTNRNSLPQREVSWDSSECGSDLEKPASPTSPYSRTGSVSAVPPWGFRSVRANSEGDASRMARGRDDSVSSSLSTMLAELEKGGDAQQLQHYGDRYIMGQVNPLMDNHEYSVEAGAVSLSSGSRKGSRSSRKQSASQ